MKKLILIILSFALLSSIVAQEIQNDIFTEGGSFINLGHGMGVPDPFNLGRVTSGNQQSAKGPYFLKYEHAASSKIGVGFNFGYGKNKTVTLDQSEPNQTYTSVTETERFNAMLRVNYHFLDHRFFDPYFGGAVGYGKSIDWSSSDHPTSGYYRSNKSPLNVGLNFTFGTRVMLTKHIGAYAEAGAALSFVQMGITAKF